MSNRPWYKCLNATVTATNLLCKISHVFLNQTKTTMSWPDKLAADRRIYYVEGEKKKNIWLFICCVTDWWESWAHPAALGMVIIQLVLKSLIRHAAVIQNTPDKLARHYKIENTWPLARLTTRITPLHPAQKVITLYEYLLKGVCTSPRDAEVRLPGHFFITPF